MDPGLGACGARGRHRCRPRLSAGCLAGGTGLARTDIGAGGHRLDAGRRAIAAIGGTGRQWFCHARYRHRPRRYHRPPAWRRPGYKLSVPRAPDGVYTAMVFPHDLARQQIIHLNRWTGETLIDARYADYGTVARLTEWGVNVHMGQEYGPVNRLVLLIACIGLAAMCLAAPVMWWKRRPKAGWQHPDRLKAG
ncbi:PepSY domain-containing protein [Tistrella bauzanensis]